MAQQALGLKTHFDLQIAVKKMHIADSKTDRYTSVGTKYGDQTRFEY